jgi:iron complex outermembrane receptor protein
MCAGLKRVLSHSALLCGLLPIMAAQAVAQETESQSGVLAEITVTARKVRENLQDTPVAVTALSGAELEQHQVFQTDQLTQVVPNLQFGTNAPLAGNNSSSQVFIRGIGQTDPTSTVDPGVGLYIDDVYIGNAVGARMDLRDIASVQVLRGPQGTLFGRNTIGGTILLSTTDPGDGFGGTVRGGFGSDKLFDGFLAVDVPVSSTLKARFTAGRRRQDGYVTRTDGTDLGDTNTYTLTSKVIWKPTEKLEARWLADYSSADEHGSPLVFAAINTAATFPRVASADAGCPGFNGSFASLPAVPNIPDVAPGGSEYSRRPLREQLPVPRPVSQQWHGTTQEYP